MWWECQNLIPIYIICYMKTWCNYILGSLVDQIWKTHLWTLSVVTMVQQTNIRFGMKKKMIFMLRTRYYKASHIRYIWLYNLDRLYSRMYVCGPVVRSCVSVVRTDCNVCGHVSYNFIWCLFSKGHCTSHIETTSNQMNDFNEHHNILNRNFKI